MAATRVFLTQQALQEGMGKGTLTLEGDTLIMRAHETATGPVDLTMHLISAVRFVEALTDEPESVRLIGKVKDVEQLKQMKADLCDTSVIIGDAAYRVEEGFVGEALGDAKSGKTSAKGSSGRPPARNSELEVLAKLFVKKQR